MAVETQYRAREVKSQVAAVAVNKYKITVFGGGLYNYAKNGYELDSLIDDLISRGVLLKEIEIKVLRKKDA